MGLVSRLLCRNGQPVTCIDVNKDVVARLNAGSVHIFEPGLEPMVRRSHADGRLKFTTSLAEGLVGADCAFICVGTPPGEDGSCDPHYVEQVAREIGRTMENDLSWWTSPRCRWVLPTACAPSSPKSWPPAAGISTLRWSPTPNSSRKATPSPTP